MQRALLAAAMLATSVAGASPARSARLAATGTCELTTIEARASELIGRTAIAREIRGMLGDACLSRPIPTPIDREVWASGTSARTAA